MGTGMKSLKWEGIGTKNLFPHTSNTNRSWLSSMNGLPIVSITLNRAKTYFSNVHWMLLTCSWWRRSGAFALPSSIAASNSAMSLKRWSLTLRRKWRPYWIFFKWPHMYFFRLVKLYHSWKFHACCQNGTIFSPNCWTKTRGPIYKISYNLSTYDSDFKRAKISFLEYRKLICEHCLGRSYNFASESYLRKALRPS